MHEIYAYTVPVFLKTLTALRAVLVKAEHFAKEQGTGEEELLTAQLAPDMFPLLRQVQIACDNAKGATARLAGVTAPAHEDNETTFAALCARIDKTIAFVEGIAKSSFDNAETREIVLPYFPDRYLTGFDYAREYAVPNFFFHVVIAYAILREKGLDLGKADFIGSLPFHDAPGRMTS